MIQIRYVALVCGVLAGLGCGGESDDGESAPPGGDTSTVIETGLPSSTEIEDLTPQQFESACESLRDDVNRRLPVDVTTRGFCEAYGAGVANDPGMCRTLADGCVTQVNSGNNPLVTREDLDFSMVQCSSDTSQTQGCSATVGELETCLQDQVTSVEGLLADNDCDNAASIGIGDLESMLTALGVAPASCARLQSQCPGLELATPELGR